MGTRATLPFPTIHHLSHSRSNRIFECENLATISGPMVTIATSSNAPNLQSLQVDYKHATLPSVQYMFVVHNPNFHLSAGSAKIGPLRFLPFPLHDCSANHRPRGARVPDQEFARRTSRLVVNFRRLHAQRHGMTQVHIWASGAAAAIDLVLYAHHLLHLYRRAADRCGDDMG
jgi:hypothetical protein